MRQTIAIRGHYGHVIEFTYRKADGTVSDRSGTLWESRDTSKGRRVWIGDGPDRRQFNPGGMSHVRCTRCEKGIG